VRIVRRRRREHDFEFPRAGLHFFLKPRRQSSTNYELALQSGRKAVALGQTGWKMRIMIAVPTAGGIAVMIGIAVVAMTFLVAFAVTVAVVIVGVVIVFVFIMIMAVAVVLGHRDSR
jgi:hypothetical protein